MAPPADLGQTDLIPLDRSVLEICQALDRLEWSRELHWGQMETVAKYLKVFSARKGHVVFREGAKESYLCIVAEGKIAIVKEDSAHGKRVLATVASGKSFGELSLIDGEPRSAMAVATEPSTLLVLSKRDFDRLVDEAPRLAVQILMRIARLVSQRLRQTSGALVEHLKK